MVFQSYALYPNMTVEQNLAFGLRMRGVRKEERRRRVLDAAKVLGLEELLRRRPAELSGGQRQRVAMGRAMVREPLVYLMDEPLSNLDARLRVSMRAELMRMHVRLGVTTVYVTHDQVEATTLGQRVAVLKDGRLQQCATPRELFDSPANIFVASFIGSPSMNLVRARISDGIAHFAGHSVRLPAGAPTHPEPIIGFRPSDLSIPTDGSAAGSTVDVHVDVIEDLGTESMVIFAIDAAPVRVDVASLTEASEETDESLLLAEDRRARLTARLQGHHRLQPGDRVRLALDVRHLHFFDPETGSHIAWEQPRDDTGQRTAASGPVIDRAGTR
jgi:multiple sugar transport system ATP-binding protein